MYWQTLNGETPQLFTRCQVAKILFKIIITTEKEPKFWFCREHQGAVLQWFGSCRFPSFRGCGCDLYLSIWSHRGSSVSQTHCRPESCNYSKSELIQSHFHSCFSLQVKGIKKIVVAERTPITLKQYAVLQKFAVIELELDLIPITENTLHALIVQMVCLL